MENYFSEFSAYYIDQARNKDRADELRVHMFRISALIIPFLVDMIDALENDESSTSFEGTIHTAFRTARELMIVTPESDDDIEAVMFEVAVLHNQNRDIEVALDNFRYHLEKFRELNETLRSLLQHD